MNAPCPQHGWPQVGEMMISPGGYRARVLDHELDETNRVTAVVGRLFEAPDHILVVLPIYDAVGNLHHVDEYVRRRQ